MKKLLRSTIFSLVILLASTFASLAQADYVEKIEEYRSNKNSRFSNSEISPLTALQIETFNGLYYFSINEDYNLQGTLSKDENENPVSLQMSDGEEQEFMKYGTVQFVYKGETFIFDVFRKGNLSELANYPEQLFMPFKDKTSSGKTSDFGRYIAIGIPEEGNDVNVDFNKSFNPYAAYNENHISPVAPDASMINFKITVGERKYEDR